MKKLSLLLIFTLICCTILTSCDSSGQNSSLSSSIFDSSSSQSQATSDSEISSATDSSSTSSVTQTEASSQVSSTVSETTTNNNTSTQPKPTTTTTTAPNSPFVVPKVKVPTSPGTEVYKNSLAVIDASKKSQGYITIKYTGTKKILKVQVTKDGNTCTYDLVPGGDYETFPLQMGNGTYSVRVLENISGTSYARALEQSFSATIADSFLPFLYPNQLVDFNQNSACVTKAAQLCAGKSTDVDKVSAIFKFITSNIKYDTAEANAIINGTITKYIPYPDEVLSTRKGICYDYASLFAAMTRSQNIPTKLIKGYVGESGTYHAWNQVYLKNSGWVTVEIKVNAGYNTLDATFYAGSSDKGTIAANFTKTSYYKVYRSF